MPPFDRSLESPIAAIRELRARAPGAVVSVGGMTALQEEAYVATDTERLLLELAENAEHPDLLVISGSAGSGKSALIDRLVSASEDRFGTVLQDATHSDTPTEDQADILSRFFAPFADGAGGPDRPSLIAANIGMLLAFFAAIRNGEGAHQFTTLETILKHLLGISDEPARDAPWTATVVNLDLRPTAGSGGLLIEMLGLADFSNPSGLVKGAPRCATCEVRAWCPVRSNSIIAGSNAAAAAIDGLAARAAAERGRHDSPRQLWDFVARLACGDDGFDDRIDPCDAVADAAERDDHEWVWERILPRRLFEMGGDLGKRIKALDPSSQPSAAAHRALTRAGIRREADAATLLELDPGGAEALASCAAHVRSGRVSPAVTGRALVATSYLLEPDRWQVGDATSQAFERLLGEYRRFSSGDAGGQLPELESVTRLLERALGRSFGVLEGDTPYVPIKAYDPRDPSRIFVRASLSYEHGEIYRVEPDPPASRDPEGTRLAGHRPLAVTVRLGGVAFAIALPMYRLLKAAATGTVASTSDLARFYGLRRAVEALARAAADQGRELAVERPGNARLYRVRRSTTISGQNIVAVEELSR